MAFFKTLVNVGLNISNDYDVPVFKTLEKYKVVMSKYLKIFNMPLSIPIYTHDMRPGYVTRF